MADIGDSGFLKIANESDRVAVATILYKNGYTVRPVRKKKNGKANEYYVSYKIEAQDITEAANEN